MVEIGTAKRKNLVFPGLEYSWYDVKIKPKALYQILSKKLGINMSYRLGLNISYSKFYQI